MKQEALDTIIKDIAEKHTSPAITLSTRDIQNLIYLKTGEMPNTELISDSLRRIGLGAKGHKWIWNWKKSHE